MIEEALYHIIDVPYAVPVGDGKLMLRLKSAKNDISECFVMYRDNYIKTEKTCSKMNKVASDTLYDYFEAEINIKTKRPRYCFYIIDKTGSSLYFGTEGVIGEERNVNDFVYAYIHNLEFYSIPNWAKDAIGYQIFPDRFCKVSLDNDSSSCKITEPWIYAPVKNLNSFYGGNISGIISKLKYIKELGINMIYLNPIFLAPSYHRYDTEDYSVIDQNLGDIETFKTFLKKCHDLDIRVILDAVFNHCGREFFAFKDVLKNGNKSKYASWFNIYDFPIKTDPEANYEVFWVISDLPKLCTDNPEVASYLIEIAKYWTKLGIDGWRLDVASEVSHVFWKEFRKAVREINPQNIIIGEIMHEAVPWLRGDEFDSVMNYPLRAAIVEFFAKQSIGVQKFDAIISKIRMLYTEQANFAMFNLIDSHDTERFLTLCKNCSNDSECSENDSYIKNNYEEKRLFLAVLFQMTYTGIPVVYYGDEVGMEGENDPDCRRPMIWDKNDQNLNILNFYKKIIKIRNDNTVLRQGRFLTWFTLPRNNVYAYFRCYENSIMAVIINNSSEKTIIEVDTEWTQKDVLKDLLSNTMYNVKEKKLKLVLLPYEAVLLE